MDTGLEGSKDQHTGMFMTDELSPESIEAAAKAIARLFGEASDDSGMTEWNIEGFASLDEFIDITWRGFTDHARAALLAAKEQRT